MINGCLVCGSATEGSELFCKECGKFALELLRTCPRCGAFTIDKMKPECFSCKGKKIYFSSIYSHFIYCGSVSKIISSMKYGKIEYYADVLGKYLATKIPETMLDKRTVVFPPMSFLSKFKRSFNQAEIIADRIASFHNLNFDGNLIKKIRKTVPQASLTYIERQTNLKNAFALKRDVKNQNFLIVDDVCTTFSTINTISELLIKNGAKDVKAVTFARTSPYFS